MFLTILPPTYEARGKVLFSLCLSVHLGEGVPQSGPGQVPPPHPLGPRLPYPIPTRPGPGQGTPYPTVFPLPRQNQERAPLPYPSLARTRTG